MVPAAGWYKVNDAGHPVGDIGLEAARVADYPIQNYRAVRPREHVFRGEAEH